MHYRYLLLFISLSWLSCDQTGTTAITGRVLKEPAPGCTFYYDKMLKKNVYTKVEIEAHYGGGPAAYQRFLNKNLQIPQEQIDNDDLQSHVSMKFIVDTNGQIINPGIKDKSDTTNFTPLEKEAVRILRLMPKWEPAICQGKKVTSEVRLPMIICYRTDE